MVRAVGFSKGLEDPKTHEVPDLFENGLALVGSVDTVTRQLEQLLKRLPVRWLFAWMYNGLTPHDRLMKMIELFWTKVLPRVTDEHSAGKFECRVRQFEIVAIFRKTT